VGSGGGGVAPSPYLESAKEIADFSAVFAVSADAADAVPGLAELRNVAFVGEGLVPSQSFPKCEALASRNGGAAPP